LTKRQKFEQPLERREIMPELRCSSCGTVLFPDEIILAEREKDGLCLSCRAKKTQVQTCYHDDEST